MTVEQFARLYDRADLDLEDVAALAGKLEDDDALATMAYLYLSYRDDFVAELESRGVNLK